MTAKELVMDREVRFQTSGTVAIRCFLVEDAKDVDEARAVISSYLDEHGREHPVFPQLVASTPYVNPVRSKLGYHGAVTYRERDALPTVFQA